MVIDTSAILAWLKQEPEREHIVTALEANHRLSAVSLLEGIREAKDIGRTRWSMEGDEEWNLSSGSPAIWSEFSDFRSAPVS